MKDFVNAGLLILLLSSSLVQAETRYVRFQTDGVRSYGVINGERVYELDGDYFTNPEKTGKHYNLKDVELLLPVDPLRISKVLGTAVNTRRPGLELPENAHPRWFAKFPTSLNPDGAGVTLPPEASNLNYETSDGELVSSDAVAGTDTSSFGYFHRNPVKLVTAPVAKVDGIQATEIALKKIPGKANSIKIDRLGRRNVYTVEIIAAKDGQEWDVFVDIGTGKVVGIDN